MKTSTIANRLSCFAITLLLGVMLAGCGKPKVEVSSSWTDGEQVCFLIHVGNLPKGDNERVTVIVKGGGGDIKESHFDAGNGDHTICLPIPGSMPGPNTHVTANVYGSDPNDAADTQPRSAPQVPLSGADQATQDQYKSDKAKWDKDSKNWQKVTAINDSTVGDINHTAPTLPAGTVSH